MKRSTLTLLLTMSLIWVAAAQSATSFTQQVAPPNGVDDTANLQAALDNCVARGPNCTVQLAQGTYLTRQLVAYNFRGTMRGKGRDRTTIEAISPLSVNIPDVYVQNLCLPQPTSCLWPSLIIFVDGNIAIADLSIRITAPPGTATTGWILGGSRVTGLVDAVRVMGRRRTDAHLDRVAIEGRPDTSPTGFGFNVINGILYAGEMPRSATAFDYYFLSGTLTVRNSRFSNVVDGVGQDGFFKDSEVIIGGSPLAGNTFENTVAGIWLESAQNSRFNISYNSSSGALNALRIDPWLPVFVPEEPSHYSIHHNRLSTVGDFLEGVYLANPPGQTWIRAAIFDNRIESKGALLDGIGAYQVKGLGIWHNQIIGKGPVAIRLSASSDGTVIGNDLRQFDVDPNAGLAHIYLDPQAQHNFIACAHSTETVLDQGTANKVVGCRELP